MSRQPRDLRLCLRVDVTLSLSDSATSNEVTVSESRRLRTRPMGCLTWVLEDSDDKERVVVRAAHWARGPSNPSGGEDALSLAGSLPHMSFKEVLPRLQTPVCRCAGGPGSKVSPPVTFPALLRHDSIPHAPRLCPAS